MGRWWVGVCVWVCGCECVGVDMWVRVCGILTLMG